MSMSIQSKYLFPQSDKKRSLKAVDVDVDEQKRYKIVTLNSECFMSTDENYSNCLDSLFNYLRSLPEKTSKPLILDVTRSTVRIRYWNQLVTHLKTDINLLKKISSLEFSETSFSLRQLRDCYSIFQECQTKDIPFPILDIDMSQAAIQLNRDKSACEKEFSRLRKELGIIEGQPIEELIFDLNEPVNDIWKQDFLKAITKKGNVDKQFLQHIKWLENKTLYESWKDELNLDSLIY